jgi:hypothetical protein
LARANTFSVTLLAVVAFPFISDIPITKVDQKDLLTTRISDIYPDCLEMPLCLSAVDAIAKSSDISTASNDFKYVNNYIM